MKNIVVVGRSEELIFLPQKFRKNRLEEFLPSSTKPTQNPCILEKSVTNINPFLRRLRGELFTDALVHFHGMLGFF